MSLQGSTSKIGGRFIGADGGFERFEQKEEKKEENLYRELRTAETVVIGAGAGLSTSAGFVYTGERFRENFRDFEVKYGFHDMYSGGFIPMRPWKNIGLIGADIFT